MIKYKYLRWIAAVGWGAVAMVFALCALWIFTELPIEGVIFYMLVAYFVAMAIVLLLTEPAKREKKQSAQTKQKSEKTPAKEVPIFTWNKTAREWIKQ